jgi:hypothetical protein
MLVCTYWYVGTVDHYDVPPGVVGAASFEKHKFVEPKIGPWKNKYAL